MDLDDLLDAGQKLFDACFGGDLNLVSRLLESGAPVWFQEPDSEWTCLHLAAERNHLDLIKKLLAEGAVWNAVDACGFTAADIALSLNYNDAFRMIRDAGVRSEFVLRVLEKKDIEPTSLVLKSGDSSILDSNESFLKTRLRYVTDERGQEICLAQTEEGKEVGVMMGWEKPIMEATISHVLKELSDHTNLRVINIGFGLGIIDSIIQRDMKPASHIIIEPHPDVLAHMRATGWYDKPGVTILEGRWQDHIESDVVMSESFDFVYTDTFSEQYNDLVEFFEHIPNLLRDETSVFSFFNGLGATNATFASVYTDLAELHLNEVGLRTSWQDVVVLNEREKVWGESIVYYDLPYYKLPISRMAF
ncbi:arginine methyl transferase [Clavulina sp. PMI_390]|nr:arginine methyl transferase [Clavulina sp. PMI_390]